MLKQWEFMFFFFRVERLLFQMDRFSVTFVSRLEGSDEQPLDSQTELHLHYCSLHKLQPAWGTTTAESKALSFIPFPFFEIFVKRAMVLHM